MKRMTWLIALVLLVAPVASAQNHGEVGVFGHYFHSSVTHDNFGGLGGRVSINAFKYLQLEAETSYDFEQAFTEGFTNPTSGTVSFQQSRSACCTASSGLSFKPVVVRCELFVALKGGFINFRFDPRPVTFGTFTSSVETLRQNTVSATLQPSVGIEAYWGIVGLRLEVGDEMYFRKRHSSRPDR